MLTSDQARLHPTPVTSDPMKPDPISLICHHVGPNDHMTEVTLSLVSSGASDIGSSVVGLCRISPPTRSVGLERGRASSEVPPRARPVSGKASSSTRGGQPQARTASSEVGLEQIDVRSERRGDRAVRSPRATRPVPIQINIEPCISTATTA